MKGEIMGIIKDFSVEQFWIAKDKYSKMINHIKERAKEIAIELGKSNENWTTTQVEFICIDEEMEVLVNATLVKNRNEIEKALDLAEEAIAFRFPMDWLFYDDYKDMLQKTKISDEQQREKEYVEYLRLKEKFETK
jgi:hypothetical protein